MDFAFGNLLKVFFSTNKCLLGEAIFMMQTCYCCSGKVFEECCRPILDGVRKASTAEELMRSRYSAYATASVEYILRTTHMSTRKLYDLTTIRNWATTSKWLRLQIVSTRKGKPEDTEGFVEFKATYQTPDNKTILHHEHSRFLKENGDWFFVEALELK